MSSHSIYIRRFPDLTAVRAYCWENLHATKCRVLGFRDSNYLWVLNLITIHWILTVITTVIHFTDLQHINQRLVFWSYITSLLAYAVFLCHLCLYVS
jgi:hypothetical protein